jgi:hypothetical protein
MIRAASGTDERMSQIEMTGTSRLRGRSQDVKHAVEDFLKRFEWTWTNAVLFSLALLFFLVVTTSVMPSFWLYFADQKLKWNGAGAQKLLFWDVPGTILLILRDAVAMGLATGPIITVLIVAAAMQNWRRKLRGQTGDSRPTGGYR